MATSNPLRLDAELVRQAKATALIYKRTIPRQIEYWAEIGRAVESMLTQEQLLAVREGLAKLVLDAKDSGPISPEAVFDELERQREDGTLAASVTNATVRYQASEAHPGRLERIEADGNRTVGLFQDGRFVPMAS